MLKTAKSPTVASPSARRFQLNARYNFPDGVQPGDFFDRMHRASGVDITTLDADSRLEYNAERASYEHTCKSLMRSKPKRERIAAQDAVAQKWAERETRVGRSVWASSVPEWFMTVHGLVVRSAAAVRQRPRDSAPRGRRRTSRGGESRDGPRRRSDEDAEPPDVAVRGAP